MLTSAEVESIVEVGGLVIIRPQTWHECMRMALPGGDRYAERVMLGFRDKEELEAFLPQVHKSLKDGHGHLILANG